jgi:hypothetical protein
MKEDFWKLLHFHTSDISLRYTENWDFSNILVTQKQIHSPIWCKLFLTRLDLWHHLVITLHPFLEKILGNSSIFMIFLTFRYSRCLPDQSCFLIGRNSKISEITCLMELLDSWNVRYLDLQNICVFLLVKIPRWPPPQDKFNTWPYGKHISKSLLSETTEQIDRIFGWNVPLMVISKYLFYGDQKFKMAATAGQILI